MLSTDPSSIWLAPLQMTAKGVLIDEEHTDYLPYVTWTNQGCQDWSTTTGLSFGMAGYCFITTSWRLNYGSGIGNPCSRVLRLYCLQE